MIDEFLTSEERGKLKDLQLVLKLRKNLACLVLIGVESVELGNAFCQFVEENLKPDELYYYSPQSNQILYDINYNRDTLPIEKFFIIKLLDVFHSISLLLAQLWQYLSRTHQGRDTEYQDLLHPIANE